MGRSLMVLIFCIFFSACTTAQETAPVTSALAESNQDQEHQIDLDRIKQTISQHIKEVEEQHSIKLLMMGIHQNHIMLEVRKTGNVEGTLAEAEIEALKKSFFKLAGSEFPLAVSVRACCIKEAELTGKIKAFDEDKNQILIVNEQKKIGNSDLPESAWISLADDGILNVNGHKASTGFDKSIVGLEAKIWTTGVIAQSYPSQASAIKVVVE